MERSPEPRNTAQRDTGYLGRTSTLVSEESQIADQSVVGVYDTMAQAEGAVIDGS
jgi:hypothetical protein